MNLVSLTINTSPARLKFEATKVVTTSRYTMRLKYPARTIFIHLLLAFTLSLVDKFVYNIFSFSLRGQIPHKEANRTGCSILFERFDPVLTKLNLHYLFMQLKLFYAN